MKEKKQSYIFVHKITKQAIQQSLGKMEWIEDAKQFAKNLIGGNTDKPKESSEHSQTLPMHHRYGKTPITTSDSPSQLKMSSSTAVLEKDNSNPSDMEAGLSNGIGLSQPETHYEAVIQIQQQPTQIPVVELMKPPYTYDEYEQQFQYGLFRTVLTLEQQNQRGYFSLDQLESTFVHPADPIFRSTGSFTVLRSTVLNENIQMRRNTICCPCNIILDPDTNKAGDVVPLLLGALMNNSNIDMDTNKAPVASSNTIELDKTLSIEGKSGWLIDFRLAIASTENATLECSLNLPDSEWVTMPSLVQVNEKATAPQPPPRPSSPPPTKPKKKPLGMKLNPSALLPNAGKSEVNTTTEKKTEESSEAVDQLLKIADERSASKSQGMTSVLESHATNKTYSDMENELEIVNYLVNDANSRSLVYRQYSTEKKFTIVRNKFWALFVAGRDVEYFRSLEMHTEKLQAEGLLLVRRTIESQSLLSVFAEASSTGPTYYIDEEFSKQVLETRVALEGAGEDAFRLPSHTWEYILAQCEPYMQSTILENLQILVRRHDRAEWSRSNPTLFLSFSLFYRIIDQKPSDMIKFDYTPLPSRPLSPDVPTVTTTPSSESTVKTV